MPHSQDRSTASRTDGLGHSSVGTTRKLLWPYLVTYLIVVQLEGWHMPSKVYRLAAKSTVGSYRRVLIEPVSSTHRAHLHRRSAQDVNVRFDRDRPQRRPMCPSQSNHFAPPQSTAASGISQLVGSAVVGSAVVGSAVVGSAVVGSAVVGSAS